MPPARKQYESLSMASDHLSLAAIGLESEFSVFVDDTPVKPEKLFGSPLAFIRQPLMHRTGSSYHLPTGGAVYFDTGVIEIATPVIEIEQKCAARAGRSLWESLLFLREELNAWEHRHRKQIRLQGFSTHYNISFDPPNPAGAAKEKSDIRALAFLLTHILPVPVMLLAANRRSTGIGVRPRPNRIEITADFTPEPSLMIAAATLITGIVREVMTWPSYSLDELRRHEIPVIRGFKPIKHTSRKGWLAKDFTFDPEHGRSPFTDDIDAEHWRVENIPGTIHMSLRQIASRIYSTFLRPIARVADSFTLRLIQAVLSGRTPSMLDLPDRPESYDDAGKLCKWENQFSEDDLRRSRYERILMHAIAGDEIKLYGRNLKPVAMRGWSNVVFADGDPRRRRIIPIDMLLHHLEDWTHQSRLRR
jgi:hypothetical protein